MLQFVKERRRRLGFNVGNRVRTAHRAVRIRDEAVEDLTLIRARVRRGEIDPIEESGDEALRRALRRRRQPVHEGRHQDDEMPVLIDVRRRTEGVHIDWVQRLIEELAERLELARRKSVRRRERVDVQQDVRADEAQACVNTRKTSGSL